MRLVKLIANLGYGSRKQVMGLFGEGRITDADGQVLYSDDKVPHEAIFIDGEPLDPPTGLVLALHKPVGSTCCRRASACAIRRCPRWAGWIAKPPACCC